DGSEGFVGSFSIQDESGEIRVVLWDEDTRILTNENFVINEVVKIINGYTKEGRFQDLEIHVNRFGKIILSPEDIDFNKIPKIKEAFTNIGDITPKFKSYSIEGQVVAYSPAKEFVGSNGNTGKVGNINIMDSTGFVRIVFWNEDVDKIHGIQEGDNISLTQLVPRESKLNPKKIELVASSNTILKKTKGNVHYEAKIVENIKKLQELENLVSFKGVVTSVRDLRKVTLKSGEDVSVIDFEVSDNTDSIRITAWRDIAEELAEKLTNDMTVLVSNVNLKHNELFDRKEVTYNRVSEIKVIEEHIKITSHPQEEKIKPKITKTIKDLENLENNASFKGVITSIRDLRKVTLKSGEDVSVIDFEVSDNTGSIRITAWRDIAEELAEKLTNETTVLVSNVKLRYNEIFDRKEGNFNKFSEIEKIKEDIAFTKKTSSGSSKTTTRFSETKIESIDSVGFFEIKGSIIKEIDLSKKDLFIYDACPTCFKKDSNCTCEKKEEPEKRMILKVVLDDESGTIKTSFFGQQAEELIGKKASEIADMEDLSRVLKDLEGRSLIVRGKASLNNFNEMNNYELKVSEFQFTDPTTELNYLMEELNS
ncbi:MAG: OB-fold nucleic acid binding domain-containing protein, partial [Candidatus Lokiarchaeota archaeon]|nr:OB-fold nucleic acid binding domain-containing protein [Candidatus Lokiarchaeota archaeon]